MIVQRATDNLFHVHKPERILKFREADRRLYYYDVAGSWDDDDATVLVTTVNDNKSKLAYDFNRAKIARSI